MIVTRSDNTFPEQNVHVEILLPELTVVSIPEKNSGNVSFLPIGIRFTNNNQESQFLNIHNTLIPELVTSSNERLQGQLVTDKALYAQSDQYRFLTLKDRLSNLISRRYNQSSQNSTQNYSAPDFYRHNSPAHFSLMARLSWQENILKLQISTLDYVFCSSYGSSSTERFWTFTGLEAGTYQLRFIYNPEFQGSSTPLAPSEVEPAEVARLAPVASPFTSLHLIHPTGSDGNIVNINGVCFETFLPEKVLRFPRRSLKQKLRSFLRYLLLPGNYPSPSVPVQIGLRITNNTTTPLRFNFYASLTLKFTGVDGLLQCSGWCISPKGASASNFPVAHPGESLTFFQDMVLFWRWGNEFGLRINSNDGSHWICEPIRVGTYQIQFTYNTQDSALAWQWLNRATANGTDVEEALWIGQVTTPPVSIQFTQS